MVSKYEILTDEEIILQYKINKEKERARNKEAYERLKLNKDLLKFIFYFLLLIMNYKTILEHLYFSLTI